MIRDFEPIEIEEDGSEYLEYDRVIRNNGELTEWGEFLYEQYEMDNIIFDPVTKKYYKTKEVDDKNGD